jgi:hypothetical protein
MIDDIIRNADMLGDAASIIDVVERATTAGHSLRHALVSSQAPLIPQLHGQAYDVVSLRTQDSRDGGGVYTARHGYRNGLGSWHVKT